MNERSRDTGQRAIAFILRYGSLAATLLMALGLAIMLSRGIVRADEAAPRVSLARLWAGVVNFKGYEIAQCGILLMLLTPILRVVTAVGVFLARREYKYVLVSLGVLAVVLVSIGLALRA